MNNYRPTFTLNLGSKSAFKAYFNLQEAPGFQTYLLEQFRLQIKEKLRGLDIMIKARLKELLKGAIEHCSVYDALVRKNQPLYFELGAVNSPQGLYDLITILQETVYVGPPIVRKLGNRLNISIGCSAINSDFSQALALSSGRYTSINKLGQATEIPWIQWLLKSRPYLDGWKVLFGNNIIGSRTGGAIMVKTHHYGWLLPIEFSGTWQSNFVTRAVEEFDVSGQLNKFVESTLELLLK